jgi:signal transduction histidine kinase
VSGARREAAAVPLLLLVAAQAALGPHGWPSLACAGFAGAVLALRRYAPLAVLAVLLANALLATALLGTATGTGTVAVWAAVALALYTVALHRTAGRAAAGGAAAALAGAAAAAAQGRPPQEVLGTALVVLGVAAVVWALGRSHRRRRADLDALAAFRAGCVSAPGFAAAAERGRMAAELHDAAAHRLTGIAVSAAAALRLDDPARITEALRHASAEGRRTLAELDRLAAAEPPGPRVTLADIDALAARHGVAYHRTVRTLPPRIAEAVHRVVTEALTNAARYAGDAPVRVSLDAGADPGAAPGTRLTVTVQDSGGHAAAPGLGGGHGLAGLRRTVAAVGGALTAAPTAADPAAAPTADPAGTGWTVRADLPLTAPRRPSRRGRWGHLPRWRGPSSLDWALVLLAVALSLGADLLSGGLPHSYGGLLPTALVVPLAGLHALPLGWRRRAPALSLAAVLATLLLWLALDLALRAQPPLSDVFLVRWWVELTLVYAVGAYLPRHGWPAPLAVAAVGGLVLAEGPAISGSRAGAWAVLCCALAVPAFAVWSLGRRTARRRDRRAAAQAHLRAELAGDTAEAVRRERRRIADGLARTTRAQLRAVVAAADAGSLEPALERTRAALAALRQQLTDLNPAATPDDPPPTLVGAISLATRYNATVRYATVPAPAPGGLPAALEVAAYRAAAMLLADGAALTVLHHGGGVELSGPRPQDPHTRHRLHALADAVGGTLSTARDGAALVWLPEVSPWRSP